MTWELGLPKNEPTTVKVPASKSLKLKPPEYKIKIPERHSSGCVVWSLPEAKETETEEFPISWAPMFFFGAVTFFFTWIGLYMFALLLGVTFLGCCMNVIVQIVNRLRHLYPRNKVVREIAKYPAWLMGISFVFLFLVLGFMWH